MSLEKGILPPNQKSKLDQAAREIGLTQASELASLFLLLLAVESKRIEAADAAFKRET